MPIKNLIKYGSKIRILRIANFVQNLFIPPICIHCQARRWASTPLCLTCLKSLRPFRLPPGQILSTGSPKKLERVERVERVENYGSISGDGFSFTSAHFLFPLSPGLSNLIHGFKYRHLRRHIPFLCHFLKNRSDLIQFLAHCDGIVPVPIHPTRRRERGYNQAEEIAKSLSALTGCPVIADALKRIRHTESQTKLAREERGQNLQQAFAFSKPSRVHNKKIILVDDVFTTGATAEKCASLLLQGGAKQVDVFTLAMVTVKAESVQDDFNQEMATISGYVV